MPVVAAIPPPPFQEISLGPLDLRMYGLLIAVGALLAFQLTISRYERFGGDPAIAERASMLALLAGLLGARIGYVLPRLDDFITRPGDILAIWQGGLVFFGGLAGGTLAVVLYLRRKQADLPAFLDAIAPALPLAQAIGRWGNYFNQELYGRPTDVPWALEVEERFRRPGFTESSTFHPTFLYESLWNFGLVVVLLFIDRKGWLKRRGSLLFVYLIGYGIGRGWIEALRIDTVERYAGLSRNNWIAILVVLIGLIGLRWWERRGPAKDEADADEANTDEANTGEANTGEANTDEADTDEADTDAGGDAEDAEQATGTEEPEAEEGSDTEDAPETDAEGAVNEEAAGTDEAEDPAGSEEADTRDAAEHDQADASEHDETDAPEVPEVPDGNIFADLTLESSPAAAPDEQAPDQQAPPKDDRPASDDLADRDGGGSPTTEEERHGS